MTVTLSVTKNPAIEVTLECESYGYIARVYENFGGVWKETHTSRYYKSKDDAVRSYRRFVGRYIK